LLLVGGLGAMAPRPAHAHGGERLLGVASVAAGHGNAASVVFAGLTFGAMLSTDGGKRFDWICEEALLGETSLDPLVAVVDPSTVLYGDTQAGLLVSRDAGCSFAPVASFAPPFRLRDVALHGLDRRRVYVVGDRHGEPQGTLWQSDDGGTTFGRHTALPEGLFASSVATSADRPHRTWLAATNNGAFQSAKLLVRESDEADFAAVSVLGAPPMAGDAKLAVAPDDANQILVGFLDLTSNGTQVLRSGDGGHTWQRALLVREPLRALAYGADGLAWASGTTKTFRSTDGGRSFSLLSRPSRNACIATTDERDWLCGDESLGDGAALFSTNDHARHLQPAFRLAQLVGPYRCGPDSALFRQCGPAWAAVAQRVGARVPAPKTKRP
jgi:hypothetical protein